MVYRYYILQGKEVVGTNDPVVWAKWFEESAKKQTRTIKQEVLPNGRYVSTVFLGLDHAWGYGLPQLFETVVFDKRRKKQRIFGKWKMMLGDELDVDRCATWDEAEQMHEQMVYKWSNKT